MSIFSAIGGAVKGVGKAVTSPFRAVEDAFRPERAPAGANALDPATLQIDPSRGVTSADLSRGLIDQANSINPWEAQNRNAPTIAGANAGVTTGTAALASDADRALELSSRGRQEALGGTAAGVAGEQLRAARQVNGYSQGQAAIAGQMEDVARRQLDLSGAQLATSGAQFGGARNAEIMAQQQGQLASGFSGDLSMFRNAAQGTVPSAAEIQQRAGLDQAVRNQLALAATSRDPGAMYRAQQGIGDLQGAAVNQAAQLRAQEQAAARQALIGEQGAVASALEAAQRGQLGAVDAYGNAITGMGGAGATMIGAAGTLQGAGGALGGAAGTATQAAGALGGAANTFLETQKGQAMVTQADLERAAQQNDITAGNAGRLQDMALQNAGFENAAALENARLAISAQQANQNAQLETTKQADTMTQAMWQNRLTGQQTALQAAQQDAQERIAQAQLEAEAQLRYREMLGSEAAARNANKTQLGAATIGTLASGASLAAQLLK